MSIYSQCSILLVELKLHLKQAGLWSNISPSIEQLNSVQPFAVDTLKFEQWLQFIFMPKMTILINSQANLPSSMDIHPMAFESFKYYSGSFNSLLTTIKKLDDIINRGN